MDNELITKLAQARARLDEAKRAREALLAAVTDSADYKLQLEFITQAQADIETATAAIKDEALGAWTATGSKKPHPAIGIKVTRKLVYDPIVALMWAKKDLAAAVIPPVPPALDTVKFEKWAKDNPPEFVTFIDVPTVTFAKDLSEYLPKAEAE